MSRCEQERDRLKLENERLRQRLQETQETLDAIRNGEVDALVVDGPKGQQVFSLQGVDHSYRVLVEHMQTGALIVAEDGHIRYANQFMQDLLDIPLERIIGHFVYDFVHNSHHHQFRDAMQHSQYGNIYIELDLAGNSGFLVPVYVSVVKVELEDDLFFCLALADLQELKRQEALLVEERLSRNIINQSADAIIVCNEKGVIIRASRMAFDLLGRNCLREHFDNAYSIYLVKETEGFLQDRSVGSVFSIQEVIEGRDFHSCDVLLDRAGAVNKQMLLSAGPLLDESGGCIGGIVNLTDITESVGLKQDLSMAFHGIILALSNTLEQKDAYTAGHQERTTHLACRVAQNMGLDDKRIQGLFYAGMVHDMGKISVPVEILTKPGRLTEAEFALIKRHPLTGYAILKDIQFPWPIAHIVYQHHERMNGSGYPSGLAGENILLEARILAVADVVEAMTSHRPYRPGLGIDLALQEIEINKEILYDAQVAEVCLSLFREQGWWWDEQDSFWERIKGQDRKIQRQEKWEPQRI